MARYRNYIVLDFDGIVVKHRYTAVGEDIGAILWVAGRLSEGWMFGPVRNDEKRETPCLVPFEELSDKEKIYGWNTAVSCHWVLK